MTTGDFNGDGILDLAVTNAALSELQIYLGNGDGSFRAGDRVSFAYGFVAAGDFNGDGIDDLATLGNYGSPPMVTLYSGGREGNLRESGKYAVCIGTDGYSSPPRAIATGVFNGAKRLDLAINCGTGISILRNEGGGRFELIPAVQAADSGSFGALMAVADFDGDGQDDLIAVSTAFRNQDGGGSFVESLMLASSDGNGGFRAPLYMTTPWRMSAMIAGNFDDDRKPDLAIVDGAEGTVRILRNAVQLEPGQRK